MTITTPCQICREPLTLHLQDQTSEADAQRISARAVHEACGMNALDPIIAGKPAKRIRTPRRVNGVLP